MRVSAPSYVAPAVTPIAAAVTPPSTPAVRKAPVKIHHGAKPDPCDLLKQGYAHVCRSQSGIAVHARKQADTWIQTASTMRATQAHRVASRALQLVQRLALPKGSPHLDKFRYHSFSKRNGHRTANPGQADAQRTRRALQLMLRLGLRQLVSVLVLFAVPQRLPCVVCGL